MGSNLSVLMPVRDGGPFIRRAVRSTLRAMASRDELLVMDDGSQDSTGRILSSFNDSRLKVFRREKSAGVANALNSLLEEANSDYLARMDADDVCLPWRFALQRRILGRYGGVVFGNVVYSTKRGVPVRPTFRLPRRDFSAARQLLNRNPFVHPTMMTERGVMQALGGYQVVGAEDYDLWLRMAQMDVSFSVVGFPVLIYRQHQGQVTGSHEQRYELRSKWFAEEKLVRSWASLADKTLGLRLSDRLDGNSAWSIDSLRSASGLLHVHGGDQER